MTQRPERVIGIDLGTTNSCASVVIDGEVHVIPDEQHKRTQASVVAFLQDGSVVVGNGAKREMVTNPEHTVYSAKRLIGRHMHSSQVKTAITTAPYKITGNPAGVPQIEILGETYGLPEISGMVLRRIKDLAERYVGAPISQAVITVPANFNDTQRQMTKLAGQLAGLEVLRVINEPTAAALAYGYGGDVDARLAIYDFGGGTFDITILDVRGNVFEVLATAGDTYLGGDDFDLRLLKYMLLGFRQQHGFSIEDNVVARARLLHVSERLKCELSRKDRAVVNVREVTCNAAGEPCDLRFQVDRDAVEARWLDLVQRSFLVCDEAMHAAKMKAADVDGVLLVGGTTRMPLVRKMVGDYFGQAPLTDVNPDEVVAIGAGIQGEALLSDPFSPGGTEAPLLLDVTPMSLGVKTVSGYYDKLIERNASIPCEQTRLFTTGRDDQTSVRLQIYQGESNQASQNVKLGELEMYGLRAAPRGAVQIEVTFQLNTDGIVMVTARDRETGMKQGTRIQVSAGYSPEEVEHMITRSV